MWRIILVLLLAPLAAAHGDETHEEPAWSSDALRQGETYSREFLDLGSRGYKDAYTDQTGEVVVVAGGVMEAAVEILDSGFRPAAVEIAPGGKVTWTVADDGLHTVTSTEVQAPSPGEDSPIGAWSAGLAAALAAALRRRRV